MAPKRKRAGCKETKKYDAAYFGGTTGYQHRSYSAGKAEPMDPHDFETTIELAHGGMPKIRISASAVLDMNYIIRNSGGEEISWLGTVEKDGNTYTIMEVILFKQEVTYGSTELDRGHIGAVTIDLIRSGQRDKVKKLKFWGHVHPSGSTSPSGQDDFQMKVFEDGNQFFIRGIFGRNGRAEFTLYDYVQGVRFNDVEWKPLPAENLVREEELKDQIAELVTKKVVPVTPHHAVVSNHAQTTGRVSEEDLDRIWELYGAGLGGGSLQERLGELAVKNEIGDEDADEAADETVTETAEEEERDDADKSVAVETVSSGVVPEWEGVTYEEDGHGGVAEVPIKKPNTGIGESIRRAAAFAVGSSKP